MSHYHSKAHECMAVLSGTASIRFGAADTSSNLVENTYGSSWENGALELQARAGDVFIIPAGVAHKTYNTQPEADFRLLTPGNAHDGLAVENIQEILAKIELDGYTMMGAYSGGDWDFVTEGVEFESVWAVPKPKYDPVFGDSKQGLVSSWRGIAGTTRPRL